MTPYETASPVTSSGTLSLGRALGYLNRATPELVSKRLGCVIDQPEYPGPDLAVLCLRGS